MTKTSNITFLVNRIFLGNWVHGSTFVWGFPDFPDSSPFLFLRVHSQSHRAGRMGRQ